jgi:hypothetical protein
MARPGENERIELWRYETCQGLGFSAADAVLLAGARHVDLHALTRLVAPQDEGGLACPLELALEIVL